MGDYSQVDYQSMVNDAQQRRDQAKLRFMALASARQAYTNAQQRQYEEQVRKAQEADLAGNENILGSAGTGALSGLQSGGPWGALAGAAVGLGAGAYQSYNAQKAAGKGNEEIMWGSKHKSTGSKIGDVLKFAGTGGLSSLFGGDGSGKGLMSNVMSGGVSGALNQMRSGTANMASFIPGTKYTATAGMLGGLAGYGAGKGAGALMSRFGSGSTPQVPNYQLGTDKMQLNKPDISGFYDQSTDMSQVPSYADTQGYDYSNPDSYSLNYGKHNPYKLNWQG